jgi:hypothetical protein
MSDDDRVRLLDRVRSNIAAEGHHVTLVQGGRVPRFAYSVGLTETGKPELVLAGATSLSAKAVKRVLDQAVQASDDGSLTAGAEFDVPDVGAFRAIPAHPSWIGQMLLGASDYYDRDDLAALQLVPDGSLRTIDVPDMSHPWDPDREPVWRWLREPWDLAVAPSSVAVTNLDALRGQQISEAARWEESDWEMFAGAGPDVPQDQVRVVPLATLVGFDPSLAPVTQLAVGEAIRRVPPGPWEPWRKSSSESSPDVGV